MANKLKRIEQHILLGCSDARDVSQALLGAIDSGIKAEAEKGVLIDFHRVSAAGSFVTKGSVGEIKGLIFDCMNKHFREINAGVPIDIYVHITAHGHAQYRAGITRENATFTIHDIELPESGAQYNCGMRGAAGAAIELEGIILKEKPTLHFGFNGKAKKWKIKSVEDLQKTMQAVYGHPGSLATWAPSINDLRSHPKNQKDILRLALNADPATKGLQVRLTAGLHDYEQNQYFRVDGNMQHRDTFIDRMFEQVQHQGHDEKEHRIGKQTPQIGLFHHGEIIDARAIAYRAHVGGEFKANTVCAIGGRNLPEYTQPFGPYNVVGFFYFTQHLHVKEWVVMGRNEQETLRIKARIDNDPLVNFIAAHQGVRFSPATPSGLMGMDKTAADVRAAFPQRVAPTNGAKKPVAQLH